MQGFYEWARDISTQELSRFTRNLDFPAHFHRCQELIHCNEESFEIYLDDEKYTLSKGDYVLIHSFTSHYIEDTGRNTCYMIPVKYSNDYLEKVGNCRPVDPVIRGKKATDIEQILSLYDMVVNTRDESTHSKRSEIASHGFANLLLGKLLEIIEYQELPSKVAEAREMLIKTDQYIRAHYREDINLDILAKHCGYSRSYYSSTINATLHSNLTQYINSLRIYRFVSHYDKNLSIEYQAEAVGFTSKQTFYRAFKDIYGCSPKDILNNKHSRIFMNYFNPREKRKK